MDDSKHLKKYPAPDLRFMGEGFQRERWLDSYLVTFPVSEIYNGGVIIGGVHYDGVEVGPPILDAGFKLISIGCGRQLNVIPPLATMYLRPPEVVNELPKDDDDIQREY